MPDKAAPDNAISLKINLLGGFRVAVGLRSIDSAAWRLRKAAAIVKLLALTPGHCLHRDQLLDWLWPKLDPDAAVRNLRYALHVARGLLEPADTTPSHSTRARAANHASRYLQLRRDQLSLRPSELIWTDVATFESAAEAAQMTQELLAYRTAIECYAGDLLPEDRYEDWAASRREELRLAYLRLLLDLSRLHQSRREPQQAIEALERLVRHEPADEAAHASLMRLYAAVGQRHQALRQFARLREALSRDLDAEPSEVSRRLYHAILSGAGPRVADGGQLPAPISSVRPSTLRPNLPTPLTSFVGRKREIAALKALLVPASSPSSDSSVTAAGARLVTLTGIAGSGKTRLALAVATDLVGAFEGAVWFVDLGPSTEPDLVAHAIAAVPGWREEPGRPLALTIANALGPQRLLLVLDNCEHLLEAAASLVDTLLASCPKLRVLATSQQAFDLAGEAVWRVSSLSLTDLTGASASIGAARPAAPSAIPADAIPAIVAGSDALQLFVERARLSQPSFTVTPQNLTAAVNVCQRLDGLPLALELAAVRLKVLSVEELATRLGDRFRLLTGGSHAALPRHKTLRAAIDWTHDLLSEPEQILFRRLSVFVGGWTLVAAETVCAEENASPSASDSGGQPQSGLDPLSSGLRRGDVLDLISHLVDKSLVVVEEKGGTTRSRFLETIREYADERLRGAGEFELMRARHASFVLRLAEETDPDHPGAAIPPRLLALEAEHDNLRAGLEWALATGARETALRLCAALWWFWNMRGHWSEGRGWLDRVLRQPAGFGQTAAEAKALHGAGVLALSQGDYPAARARIEASLGIRRELSDLQGTARSLAHLGELTEYEGNNLIARSLYEESLAIERELGSQIDIASSLNRLGNLSEEEGDYARARALYDESLLIRQGLADRRGIAASLNSLGEVARCEGDDTEAAERYSESLELYRELGNTWGIASALHNLGHIRLHYGDPLDAAAHFMRSLTMRRELGSRPGIAECLAGLGGVAAAAGQADRAARLFAAAQGLLDAVGTSLESVDRAEYDRGVALARASADETSFTSAWAAGQAMPVEAAIVLALSDL